VRFPSSIYTGEQRRHRDGKGFLIQPVAWFACNGQRTGGVMCHISCPEEEGALPMSRVDFPPAKVYLKCAALAPCFPSPVPRLRCPSSPSPSTPLLCQLLDQRSSPQLRHLTTPLTGIFPILQGSNESKYSRVFSASPNSDLASGRPLLVPSPPSLSLLARRRPCFDPPMFFLFSFPESLSLTYLSSFPTHTGVNPRV